ncbi:uncharacterized protein LOC100368875 [Saccoglossus kowalevskii]|uniref:Uncharacterized protein LOC100368875 n=1 Tax=Saccoglossus kowalevskii TaxID=10224 RepID=A0ABM0GMG7_SACKO|nr:PREDICTED: uncharacterized protein LOC100368875 [Saccoglossus kowalevskii]
MSRAALLILGLALVSGAFTEYVPDILSDFYYQPVKQVPTVAKPEYNRTWLFSTSLTPEGEYEYTDEEGNIQGFLVDLMNEVCKEAGKECAIMYDDYNNCYTQSGSGRPKAGQGLLGNWYDGCFVYYKTTPRIPLFDFTDPFSKLNVISEFYVLIDSEGDFDPSDVSGKRIGFLSGWSTDEACIVRDGRTKNMEQLEPSHKIYVADIYTLLDMLKKQEVDAIFVAYTAVNEIEDQVKAVGPGLECTGVQGSSSEQIMLLRKGSPVRKWWNDAFKRIRENGKYYKMCSMIERKHGKPVTCIGIDE